MATIIGCGSPIILGCGNQIILLQGRENQDY